MTIDKRVLCIVLLAGLLWFVGGSVCLAQNAGELTKAGDAAFLMRATDKTAVATAITYWGRASAQAPKDVEPFYKTAMAYCFLGRFATTADSAARYYQTATTYAKTAIENDPKSAAAHYWMAIAVLRGVDNKSKFAKLAVQGDVMNNLLSARSLNPNYYFGGPDREIGAIALKSPVPSLRLAEKHLTAALAISPSHSANLLLIGQLLIAQSESIEGRKMLEKVLKSRSTPGFEKELGQDKEKASQLLKKFDSKIK
jgi:hypothetical protein